MHVVVLVDPAGKRLFYDVGLLEDLLEHEVFEAALLRGSDVPRDVHHFTGDRIPVVVGKAPAVAPDDHDLALLQDDLFAGVLENGRRVGSDKHFAFADADYQWACAVASKDQMFGIVRTDDAECVSAAYLAQRPAYRFLQV